MWFFNKKKVAPVFFTNTLSGKKEEFKPITPGKARLYSCGPTVYGPIQIGNLRSFVLADLVGRVLGESGYKVTRVMNITDVGHMVGDGDEGEDKMQVGAARDKTTPEAIADKYATLFLKDIEALGINTAELTFPRATSYIKENIEMIQALEKKGFTYTTSDGVYFDTTKFPDYGALLGVKDAELRAGARVEIGEKHSPHDFVLWRTAKPDDLQKWDSPWGVGNPGWSIECSSMSKALLGEQIDIHTGGEDNAPIHHNNEIAQSEASSGTHPYVRYWIHGAFLTMGGEKLSKSLGNSFTLADVVAKGYHPLALRYLFLQAHYRSPLSFSWDALKASDEALKRLWRAVSELPEMTEESGVADAVHTALRDDLSTPQALALLWGALGNTHLSPPQKRRVVAAADAVLGLSLLNPPPITPPLRVEDLPKDIQEVARKREMARAQRDFAASDELRIHLLKRGYAVEDQASGTIYTRSQ